MPSGLRSGRPGLPGRRSSRARIDRCGAPSPVSPRHVAGSPRPSCRSTARSMSCSTRRGRTGSRCRPSTRARPPSSCSRRAEDGCSPPGRAFRRACRRTSSSRPRTARSSATSSSRIRVSTGRSISSCSRTASVPASAYRSGTSAVRQGRSPSTSGAPAGRLARRYPWSSRCSGRSRSRSRGCAGHRSSGSSSATRTRSSRAGSPTCWVSVPAPTCASAARLPGRRRSPLPTRPT